MSNKVIFHYVKVSGLGQCDKLLIYVLVTTVAIETRKNGPYFGMRPMDPYQDQ